MYTALIACSLSLGSFLAGQDPEMSDWEQKMKGGRAALDAAQYSDADKIYTAALAECRLECATDERFGYGLFQLGLVRMGEARNDEAASLIERSIAILASQPRVGRTELALAWTALGSSLYYQKLYTRAEHAYRAALEIRQSDPSTDQGAIAELFSSLGSIYQQQHRCGEAGEAFEQASGLLKRDARDFLSRAALLNNIGTLRRTCGPVAQAEEAFRQALQSIESVEDRDGVLTITVLNNLALEHLHRKDYSEAAALFSRALIRIEQSTPLPRADVARVMRNYAICLRKMGNRLEARRLDSSALVILSAASSSERNVVDVGALRFENNKPMK